MGRLKPGWTLERASQYFYSLSPGLFAKTAPEGYSSKELKAFKDFRLAAYAAGAGVSHLRDQYNSSLDILLVITGLVLLIACANLANLMLARARCEKSRDCNSHGPGGFARPHPAPDTVGERTAGGLRRPAGCKHCPAAQPDPGEIA
jgi:hypothetical protein